MPIPKWMFCYKLYFYNMKLIILVFCLLVQVGINAQNLMDLKKNVQQKIQQQAGSFSEDEAAAALRQALSQGATLGAEAVHKTDGYFKNLKIKNKLNKKSIIYDVKGFLDKKVIDARL